jgi:glycosyltransferase involved in cell wall biosynthesis
MNGSNKVSVIIFVLNEEENLPQCLGSLDWCDDVLVVDSFSTDSTLKICGDRNISVAQHEFRGFGSQRNWALENLDISHDWVLILDADERVTRDLAQELCVLAESSPTHIGAYRVKRRFYLWGKWLRHSSLYPTWVVRFIHRDRVRYIDRGHAETQEVNGTIGEIKNYLIDENLKNIDAWFARQNAYSRAEALFELESERSPNQWKAIFDGDPMRRRAGLKRIAGRLPFRGALYFLYCYVFRLGFLDGKDGLFFCRMKSIYQSMVEIKKYEGRKN